MDSISSFLLFQTLIYDEIKTMWLTFYSCYVFWRDWPVHLYTVRALVGLWYLGYDGVCSDVVNLFRHCATLVFQHETHFEQSQTDATYLVYLIFPFFSRKRCSDHQ